MPVEEITRAIENPPQLVANANMEAMRDSNPAADWVMENCIPSPGEWIQIGVREELKDAKGVFFKNENLHLYPNYLQWCRQNGREALSIRRFSPKVIDVLKNCLGVDVLKTERNGLVGIQGIRLKTARDPAHDWLKTSK